MATRYIQRRSLQARITHGFVMASCVWLTISGLFVFIPALANALPDVARFMRISHRVVGCVFILVPVISALASPKAFKNFIGKFFTKWTPEDKEFMKKFLPYMLSPKRVHMPDQDEVKSGQRIADFMLIVCGVMMAISGVSLWLGTSVLTVSGTTLTVLHFIHDLFFILLVAGVISHAYLGAGLFQPYRGNHKLMFGNGQISESDALYQWGFWAREELEDGSNVIVKED